jgi:hypothetical protein
MKLIASMKVRAPGQYLSTVATYKHQKDFPERIFIIASIATASAGTVVAITVAPEVPVGAS